MGNLGCVSRYIYSHHFVADVLWTKVCSCARHAEIAMETDSYLVNSMNPAVADQETFNHREFTHSLSRSTAIMGPLQYFPKKLSSKGSSAEILSAASRAFFPSKLI